LSEAAGREDFLSVDAHRVNVWPVEDRAAFAHLRDFFDSRPSAPIELGPLQVDGIGAPFFPDTRYRRSKRDEAWLIKGIAAKADAFLFGMDRARDDAAGAFAAGFPGHAVVIGVANIDTVGAEPPDQAIGCPQTAIGGSNDRLIGIAVAEIA